MKAADREGPRATSAGVAFEMGVGEAQDRIGYFAKS